MISIRNVVHDIAGRPILCDVSLDLPKHGISTLIQPNGAGTSPLLSLVARLLPLQQGRITVDAHDLTTCDTAVLARILAICRRSGYSAPAKRGGPCCLWAVSALW
ncbi:ATP-binding cassette domain-containing protein [Tateyamaria omphalii]|uniref:ABC transporter domain-containing protein n=1 Tax=Tateyamaria omphalii TaxID=299262 RepID=A0A1P8MV53_9RHOB|nr:hypothetical protein BWR18_09785 [Tateyamaria omphalii]